MLRRMINFSATAVAAGALMLLAAAAAAQAAQPVVLDGMPCLPSATGCQTTAMYEPHAFDLGAHYWFTDAKWRSWNAYTASAVVTLHAGFMGVTSHRTTIIFSNVKTLCGVRTYTRWVSGDGNAEREVDDGGGLCEWYIARP